MAKGILYLYHYNNYYNRQLKIGSVLSDYGTAIYSQELYFNPNDHVNTEVVIGQGTEDNFYDGTADYAVYTEGSGQSTTICSCWFIIEQSRVRAGQYKLILRKDVVAQNWEQVKTAPMFIEKATLGEANPLIYNQEEMTLNQIKTSEYLIKDKSNIPWLVGYFVPGTEMTTTTPGGTDYDISLPTLENDIYYGYTDSSPYLVNMDNQYNQLILIGRPLNYTLGNYVAQIEGEWNYAPFTEAKSVKPGDLGGIVTPINTLEFTAKGGNTNSIQSYNYTQDIRQTFLNNYYSQILPQMKLALEFNTRQDYETLQQNLNQIIYVVDTGKYYKRNISVGDPQTYYSLMPGTGATTIQNLLFNPDGTSKFTGIGGYVNDSSVGCSARLTPVVITYEELNLSVANLTIPADAPTLTDAPYSMFAMPYGEISVSNGENFVCTTNAEVEMQVATELLRKYGAGDGRTIYDLQLLPYCPLQTALTETGINLTGYTYYQINSSDVPSTIEGVIILGRTGNFQVGVNYTLNLTNKKLQNQTDLYRLVSPNYDGQFDFNLAKNNGLVGFNIYCSYKPFQPYIQVTPVFNGLYGQDFADARGLICGGDFSLAQLSNAWESYQLSNKNYQRIFDRQIENMEVSNRYANIERTVQAITGTVQGGTAGALTGAMVGGPVGAGIGATLGATASAIGGVADVEIQKALQREAIDYKRDLFGYQLGNIRALPNSLSKVSAFVITNKIYPFLEYYTCTPEEKRALANKIAYNGMTVMAIGTIQDFLNNVWSYTDTEGTIQDQGYIKGQLIRLTTLEGEYHELNELARELALGVYTK